MTVVELLRAARNKISDEKNWTRGTLARTKFGVPCPPTSNDAACWCAAGAIMSELTGDIVALQASEQLNRSIANRRGLPVSRQSLIGWFNDHATHERVIEVFDNAIRDAM